MTKINQQGQKQLGGQKKGKKIWVAHEGRTEEKQRTRTNGIDDRHLIRGWI